MGAGVSGLCAAIFLARRGNQVELWEAAPQPGGLLTPVEFCGIPCDLGSHRVHGEALPVLAQAAQKLDWQTRPRRGALILNGQQIDYPLRLSGFLRGLGYRQAARFGWSFLSRKASLRKFASWEQDRAAIGDQEGAKDDPGFEHFVCERVGKSAYEAFYRPYAEKVWGLPAREISTVVAKKRIATARPFVALRQALRHNRQQVATFAYPRLGMGALVQALCDEARACGVTLRLQRRFGPADLADGRWQRIIYSGHLGELLPQRGLGLGHRGLYLIYLALAIPGDSPGETDTYYAPEGCYWFGRVSVPRNFSPALAARGGETVLCVEIPEGRFGPGRDFLAELDVLLAQLRDAGILPRGKAVRPTAAHQVFLPRIYPLYHRGWIKDWWPAVREATHGGKLFPIGRQGLFLHCNIDHCVQIAADLSQHIESGGNAWDWVNTADRYLDLRVRD